MSGSGARPVAIDTAQSLGGEARRNLALRASATADGMEPRSVIIKATRAANYDRKAADAYEKSGFVKEWAAASYLARHPVAQPFSPALLADDLDRGVLVSRMSGEAVPSLVGPLLHGTASEAEQALTAYAEALASLRAYRVALGSADPAAGDDDAFRGESAFIDTVWLLGNLAWLLKGALAEDGTWGRATNRSRILTYLQRALQSIEDADLLPRLRVWATTLRNNLRSRWPDTVPLSDFPAFARTERAS